ncbi:MAG TPA: undecaprenyl-phosphate glucose phosphotransferase, partial [Afipia sp.]
LAASLIGGAGYQLAVNSSFGNVSALFGAGLIAALLYGLIAHSIGFYSSSSLLSRASDLRRVVVIWSIVGLLLSLLAFLFKVGADFSRGSIICFSLLALVLLSLWRINTKWIIANALARGTMRGRRVVLLGQADELLALEGPKLLRSYGFSEVGRVQLDEHQTPNLTVTDFDEPLIDAAIAMARDHDAEEIVLALPWRETARLDFIRSRLRSSPLPVQLLPDSSIRTLIQNPANTLKHSLTVEMQRAPLLRIEQLLKRLLDIFGATLALIVLSPLMAIAALAIKLDSPGPVLFRQRRTGFNSKQFSIFKFRTMSVMEDGPIIQQARPRDARVTRVGALLRRSSIDELPQLFNVLAGNMSCVGPRPHAVAHDHQYGDLLSEYALRHHVKPGISGWAQVNGYRGQILQVEQMKTRVEYDLWYINNWSLLLDLKIAVLTCLEVIRRRNAF